MIPAVKLIHVGGATGPFGLGLGLSLGLFIRADRWFQRVPTPACDQASHVGQLDRGVECGRDATEEVVVGGGRSSSPRNLRSRVRLCRGPSFL